MKIVLAGAIAMFALLGIGEWMVAAGAERVGLASWTAAMLCIAIIFYRMRQRNRLWYGGFELTVSLVAFYFGLTTFYESEAPATVQLILGRMLLMFAAIYVMVRALDNIGSGLEKTRWASRWNRIFGA